MDKTFTETQRRLLLAIFERGADGASQALSKWLNRPVKLSISGVDEVDITEAVGLLGPEDMLVAGCSMDLEETLSGELLLVFEDRSGLALVDFILDRPAGTAREWEELEQSAALETANIVGCAFLNALAAHLPSGSAGSQRSALLPSPPTFRREYAATLLQFALMDQVMSADHVIVVRSLFTRDEDELAWWLVFIPRGSGLAELSASLDSARPG